MHSMKKILKEEAEVLTHGVAMTAEEYAIGTAMNVARIRLRGRYPETGWSVNEISKELCYIFEGSGTLFVEGEAYSIAPGDVFLIEPGERFYWDANVDMLVPCTPAWTATQYRHIEE